MQKSTKISSSTCSTESGGSKPFILTSTALEASLPEVIWESDVGRVLFEGVSEETFCDALEGLSACEDRFLNFVDLVGDKVIVCDMPNELHEIVKSSFNRVFENAQNRLLRDAETMCPIGSATTKRGSADLAYRPCIPAGEGLNLEHSQYAATYGIPRRWPTLVVEVVHQHPIGSKVQRWLSCETRVMLCLVIEVNCDFTGPTGLYRLCATLHRRQAAMKTGDASSTNRTKNIPPRIIFGPVEFGDLIMDINGSLQAQQAPLAGANIIQFDPNDLWQDGDIPPALLPPAPGATNPTIDVDLHNLYSLIHRSQPLP